MSEKKADLASIMQVLQVFVLAVGLAGVFVKLGEGQAVQRQNTGQLEELKDIVQSLVQSQVEFAATDAAHAERIDALRTRLDRIESR
tara:strand:+ start:3445 stop:3705 length:261 start_codon:yes stop_codon:yes gene_type:complete